MKNIAIVGSGGFAKEVAFLIEDINKKNEEWNILGFIDEKVGEFNGKYKVYQNDEWVTKTNDDIHIVFGLGNPSVVSKLVKLYSINPNIKYPTLIHPNVIGDWDRITIGEGNIICAGNIFTTDIHIGAFNVFNLDCTIGHDTVIGNYNVINPSVNISGGVQLNNEILFGTGCQILQYLKVIDKTIIGAGAVVTKNIEKSGVYVGSPAKRIK